MSIDNSIKEQAEAFINQRFKSIQDNKGSMELPTLLPLLVMHLVPLQDFEAGREIEASQIRSQVEELSPQHTEFHLVNSGFPKSIFNSDGYCVYNGEEICRGYAQIFRNGVIEATDASLFGHIKMPDRYFIADRFPYELMILLNNYMQLLRTLGAKTPVLLQISLMSVKGVKMQTKFSRTSDVSIPYKKDVLNLQASVITEFNDDENYRSDMKKQMDLLWNAFGLERCLYFAEND